MAPQSDWLEKDHYAVLGVSPTATPEEITKAYRRLARKLHPDANPDDPAAEERFKEASAAYGVVGDAATRAEYDEVRRLAAGSCRPGGGAGRGSAGGPFRVYVTRAGRGADLEAELHLSLEDAVFGTTAAVWVPALGREVKLRVPAGVDDGQVIRIPGRGEPGYGGAAAGDLYVTVRVAPHPRFGRRGRDLTVSVPVTYPEAVLGAEVQVPTLDGEAVTVRVPDGTPAGRVLRVRGHGVPGRNGRGDLLVTVDLAVPRRVTGEERRCIEALDQAMSWSPRKG